jgi:hypothetical protein
LAVIVPYRNRATHLKQLLPHLVQYFARDKLDRRIDVSIHVVEQTGSAPFNRGKIKNCGFALVREVTDYVCFHDVDYLPIWADYAWSPRPARLIWHGLTLAEDWNRFFGGVVLFDNKAFERVNGYPNIYWGWGPEDLELGLRCEVSGLGFERRDGTYMALEHEHAGFAAPGVYSDEAKRTHALWNDRLPALPQAMAMDGITALDFKLIKRQRLAIGGEINPPVEHYLVDIGEPGSDLKRAG